MFESNLFGHFLLQRRTVAGIDSGFAVWAVKVAKDDSRSVVAVHYLAFDAVSVKDVATAELQTGLLAY